MAEYVIVQSAYPTWGKQWEEKHVCLGNFFEYVETDDIHAYEWEVCCEQASDKYHDEEQEEWGDFVESNSFCQVIPYNDKLEGMREVKARYAR